MQLKELLQAMQNIQRRLDIAPAYICGGTARSKAMNQLDDIADLDLTTGDKSIEYLSQELSIFLAKHYSFKIKQMSDGHTSIFLGNLKLDFSSNFVVPGIDGYLRELKITKPTDLEREMFSRDFTCNALLLSLDLQQVLDPTHHGIKDIKNKVIRTCLKPEITLTSNKNRVIRALYLAAKLGFEIDPSIIEWVAKHPESVKISTEHALVEKLNAAMEYDADRTVENLTKMNLWGQIPISEKLYPFYLQHTKRSRAAIQAYYKQAITDVYEDQNMTPIPYPPAEAAPIGLLDGIYPQADFENAPLGSLYYGTLQEHMFADSPETEEDTTEPESNRKTKPSKTKPTNNSASQR